MKKVIYNVCDRLTMKLEAVKSWAYESQINDMSFKEFVVALNVKHNFNNMEA